MERKYKSDADKILKKFSKSLEEIPGVSELYYDIPDSNVLRRDGRPRRKKIYEKFITIVPKKDKQGHVLAERMKL